MNISSKGMALALALAVAGCSAQFDNHGYAPSEIELREVQVGLSDRPEVERLLGRPGDDGFLNDSAWYYVATTIRNYTYNAPEVSDRRIVAIQFDEIGIVRDVTTYGLEDGRVVELVTRTTETYGQELSIIRQLFGNISRPSLAN